MLAAIASVTGPVVECSVVAGPPFPAVAVVSCPFADISCSLLFVRVPLVCAAHWFLYVCHACCVLHFVRCLLWTVIWPLVEVVAVAVVSVVYLTVRFVRQFVMCVSDYRCRRRRCSAVAA